MNELRRNFSPRCSDIQPPSQELLHFSPRERRLVFVWLRSREKKDLFGITASSRGHLSHSWKKASLSNICAIFSYDQRRSYMTSKMKRTLRYGTNERCLILAEGVDDFLFVWVLMISRLSWMWFMTSATLCPLWTHCWWLSPISIFRLALLTFFVNLKPQYH